MEFAAADFAALVQVILIDLALAGDNAVAVGLAAAGLPAKQQRQAIFWGVFGALVLRVLFALVTVQLLQFRGILLLGGLLLFWVSWRMWQDLKAHRPPAPLAEPEEAVAGAQHTIDVVEERAHTHVAPPASFGRALLTIVIADVSMSLDNVLAVAGVSRHSPYVMAFGLVLSVILMGVAAGVIARIINTHRWIAWVGIVVIIFAAIRMVWEDLHVFFPELVPPIPGVLGGATH
jgi:YjbE family integral membrane protein